MAKIRAEVTLIDVLVDGFEKNEILYGFHWRELPMASENEASRKFEALVEEGRRWKGTPRIVTSGSRHAARWDDLEIRQAGRGILVRVRAPRFDDWWHANETWADEPMAAVHAWIHEESNA